MSDENYYSIHGDPDGTLWLTIYGADPIKLRDGPLPVYEIPEIIIDLRAEGVNYGEFSDVFKLSHAVNLHIGRLVVRTGGCQHENAADFNFECSNVTIDTVELEEGAQNAWTCKGGCSAIKIGTLLIHPSTAAHCNAEFGNWSDQSKKKTHDVKIDTVSRSDAKQVEIRVDYASRPAVRYAIDGIHWQVLAGLIIDLWVRARLLFS